MYILHKENKLISASKVLSSCFSVMNEWTKQCTVRALIILIDAQIVPVLASRSLFTVF